MSRRMALPVPLLRCRLYPKRDRADGPTPLHGNSRLFVLAFVWGTKREMCAYVRRRHGVGLTGAGAAMLSYDVAKVDAAGRWRKTPQFGDVHFYRDRLGTRVVTHELFHATLAWARRVRIDFGAVHDGTDGGRVTMLEERLAYAHGDMCSQFVTHATRAGLY